MAGTAPDFYDVSMTPSRQALLPEDVHRVMYDLYEALYYLCYNIDDDAGTVDSDYASKISTPLTSVSAFPGYPLGTAVGTYFYTPSKKLNPNGIDTVDIYAAAYDIVLAITRICAQLDGDFGGTPGADYATNISAHLTTTLGSKLAAPAEGKIIGSLFYKMEGYMENGAYTMGDLYKCLYNFYAACVQICTMLDADSGVALGTDYLATVGTHLDTAVGAYIRTPKGPTTAGS